MIRTVIVDDEERGVKNLTALLNQYCPAIELAATAGSAEEGIKIIHEHKPDLVFLDIEMPFGSGFDLLEKVKPITFEVIFTTAYDQYALKAIKFCALDYLLKPIDVEELAAAVDKVEKNQKQKDISRHLDVLLDNMRNVNGNTARRIALPTNEGLEFVEIQQIIRCEAVGNYTEFHLRDNKRFLSTKTLKQFEELLEAYNFIRVHHSHLINLDHILKYSKGDGGYVTMTDSTTVTIAKRKKNEFLNKLLKL